MIREINPNEISDEARALIPTIGNKASHPTGYYFAVVVLVQETGEWSEPISRWGSATQAVAEAARFIMSTGIRAAVATLPTCVILPEAQS